MEATDTRRDYSTYKERANNYKPTVALNIMIWCATACAKKLVAHGKFFLNIELQTGTFCLHRL